MPEPKETWDGFSRELAAHSLRAGKTMADVWTDVSGVRRAINDAWSSGQAATAPPARTQSLEALFGDVAGPLLFQPLERFRQRRPLLSALSAIEDYDSALDGLVRRLPTTAQLGARDLAAMVASDAVPTSLMRLRWWRRSARPLPLRTAVADHLQAFILDRAALDGAFQLLLAQSSLHLLEPWLAYQRLVLRGIAQVSQPQVDVAAERRRWMEATLAQDRRAAHFLGGYEAWSNGLSSRLASALLRNPSESSERGREKRCEEHRRHLAYWSRQQRAVVSVLELELQMAKFGQAATAETIAGLAVLDDEHRELGRELDAAIAWLEAWTDTHSAGSFPPPSARLVGSAERVAGWQRRLGEIAQELLPLTVETVEPRRALPGRRRPWRELEPVRTVVRALEGVAAPIWLASSSEIETAQRTVVREVERSREVVCYGFEAASVDAAGEQLAREAVDNARSLLLYRKQALPEIRPVADEATVRAESAVLLECHEAFERSRMGLLAHMTHQRGREAVAQLRGLAAAGLRGGARKAWRLARQLYRWALLRIGLISPPRPLTEPVVRRTHLGEALAVQLHARDLPMIYRRLFRLAPVEDPRFLVGREAELAGFREALSRWEGGGNASVIVVGARGSGKTSLINCARTGIFSGYELVVGQFADRIVTPADLDEFLGTLLRLPAGSDVATALATERRIIIIEELERTFLRTMNGFEALRRLLDLMYSSAANTLWAFSINETAYRYLNVVVGLGRHFSHRLNAMALRQEDLTSAILQRHNLSGLRLEFAPLPQEDPRVSRARRFLGLELNPRQLFLDALYLQSDGIFRAAFELWQGSIERVEGGTVHMRQPLAPDYRPLISELTLEDCFALKAILQHGSLTVDELAQVLATGREASRRQLERLQLLDLLEAEPVSPGLRVRPEAGRVVREALVRTSLL
jgi:AAA ATPase domain